MRKVLALAAVALAACGDDRPPQAAAPAPAPQAAPVVVNNGGGAGDALLGMAAGGALGYMAGRATANNAPQQQTQVVERHYYVRERAPASVPAAAPAQAQTQAALKPPVPVAPAVVSKPPAQVTPRVTYSTSFTQKPSTPPPRVSTPSYTSRPGAYSRR